MSAVIVLAANLDIQQAEPLKADLLALRGTPVAVDASGVERLGGLCLQVLLAARKTWAADGQGFDIAPASDAFTTQWNAFGAPDTAAVSGEPA